MIFAPGSKPRAISKVQTLNVDAIIYDLEDSVAASERVDARASIREALPKGETYALVRTNTSDHSAFALDLDIAKHADAVLVPKIEYRHQIESVAEQLAIAGSDAALWCMIETPMGVLNVVDIVSHPAVKGLIVGPNDLARTLGIQATAQRSEFLQIFSTIILAAKAYGVHVIDGVYNNFRDEVGFTAETEQGKSIGFDGKSLIHPSQIELAKDVFMPSEEEIEHAKQVIAAFEASGGLITSLNGEMIEALHVQIARQVLIESGNTK
jgi:(3S)-malyl-CoA thioesterase